MARDEETAGLPVVGERYRLLRVLGRGGMGAVYEAVDTRLDRRVAVKLLTVVEGIHEDDASLQRFLREARGLARIDHPGVVTLYDAGVEADVPFLVMQVLDGTNLVRLVAETGPLPPPLLADIAADVLQALGAAHEAGVLHRDVKPSNVSITRAGRVVLQDFGLARLAGEAAITVAGAVIGTPQFMAPEVIRGSLPEAAADLYGLGCCMYFMATGELPFGETRDVGAVVERALGEGVPRLRGMGVEYPEKLLALIDQACDREPARRPGFADLEAGLAPFVTRDEGGLARLVGELLREEAVQGTVDAAAEVTERSAGTGAGPVLARLDAHSLPRNMRRREDPADEPENPWGPLTVSRNDPSSALLPPPPPARDLGEPGTLPPPSTLDLPSLTNRTRLLVVSAMTPESALSRQREAVNLVLRGALQEAAEMFSVIVPVCLSSLGPSHPTTLTSQYWQGVCLARLGAGAEALELLSRVNRQIDKVRGPEGD